MSLEITNPIRVTGDKPDSERYIAPTVADRDQMVTDLRVHPGMQVYLLDDGGAVARLQLLTSLGPAVWEDIPVGTAAGPVGPVGPTGADSVVPGPDGAVGPVGPTGTNGTNGTNGAVGPVGPTGTQGEQGITGGIGPTGAVGPTGPVAVPPDLIAAYDSFTGLFTVSFTSGSVWTMIQNSTSEYILVRDGNPVGSPEIALSIQSGMSVSLGFLLFTFDVGTISVIKSDGSPATIAAFTIIGYLK